MSWVSGGRSSEAYDLYLRGRFYWNQRTEVSLRQAADYFQQTISRAPGYAPAYAGLADCYAALVYGCYLAPAEGFPKVRAALQRARELDPQAPKVFASEGYMNMYFDWDFGTAARNLEHAIALNPNYAPQPTPKDMQGRSFLPVWQGKTLRDWRHAMYYRYYHDPGDHNTRAPLRSPDGHPQTGPVLIHPGEPIG